MRLPMAILLTGSLYIYAVSVFVPERFVTANPLSLSFIRTAYTTNNTKCGVQGVIMSIHPPREKVHRCSSSIIKTFGCRGQCYSYTEMNSNLTRVIRSCSCCQATDFGFQQAIINCKNGEKMRKIVKFAINCHCRPCVLKPRVTLKDLRLMLRMSTRKHWPN
ncbi:bursicon [Octopus bimaculoides]|nr:bursicon [Octopus bimaculoides]|eukprot:XP_014770796.1 PREDICTED: bursicon-like [Octopus bimaculoides]